MKFEAVIAYADGEKEDRGRELHSDRSVLNVPQAMEYMERLVQRFNATLRPNERPIRVSRVEHMRPDPAPPHVWEKSNLVTIMKGGKHYDTYKCSVCGATGKRFGFSEYVSPDRSWSQRRALNLDTCKPEQGAVPVSSSKEIDMPKAKEPQYAADQLSEWYRTADQLPWAPGPYQTTAEPTKARDVLYRVFDGHLRWGPSDASLARAIERARSEGMLLVTPLYWRGLNTPPSIEYTDIDQQALKDAVAGDAPAEPVKPSKPRVLLIDHDALDKAFSSIAVQAELPLEKPRVRLVATDNVRQRVPLNG